MFSKKIKLAVIIFVLIFLLAKRTDAASLSIELSSTQVKVGDTVTATVYVNAGGEAVNNVEGEIAVPSDILYIQSVGTAGSVLNLWVEQPSYYQGSVSFNGGITNPGYSGSRGRVLIVSMKAIKNGNASVVFQSSSVRANDGLGTDVLRSKSGAVLAVANKAEAKTPITDTKTIDVNKITPVTSPDVSPINKLALNAPVIESVLAADSNKWYNTNKTTFTWKIPDEAIAIKSLFNNKANSDPSLQSVATSKSKTIENIADGIWYFHLKYKTTDGWSKVAHKKIKIDTSGPDKIDSNYELNDLGLVKLNILAHDKLSNVIRLNLIPEKSTPISLKNIKNSSASHVFSSEYSGVKDIIIEAFDEAGNKNSKTIAIDFPRILPPEIITYPSSVLNDDEIKLSGVSNYPNMVMEILVESDDGEIQTYKTQTKSDGSFNYVIKQVKGISMLNVWTKIPSLDDSMSGILSEKVKINIESGSYLAGIDMLTKSLVSVAPIIVLAIIIIGLIYLFIFKFALNSRDRIRRKTINKIEKHILSIINSLKKNIVDDIHLLRIDKDINDINEAEKIILKNLLQDFKDVEKTINAKIRKKDRCGCADDENRA